MIFHFAYNGINIDMNMIVIIKGKLDALASKHYEQFGSSFRDEIHFRDSIERCYALIASHTCREWNALFGKMMTADKLRHGHWFDVMCIPFSPIHSNDFEGLFKSYRMNGKKHKVRYSLLLSVLETGGLIEVNDSYSNGIVDGLHYPKSYRLSVDFMLEIVGHYLKDMKQGDVFNVFNCFNAYYPNRLLEQKLMRAKKLYDELAAHEGVSVVLPDNWHKTLSLFGWFGFDSELDIDTLLRGLLFFQKHETYGYTGGRFYDWFSSCPFSFRKYLLKDGKHYRELVDCHSGFFWMFAIYGFGEGWIDEDECLRMIDHCFSGKFYEDISGTAKTRAVKTEFMKVLNMTVRQVGFMVEDELFNRIKDGLSKSYPQWMSFLEAIRANPKMRRYQKIGKFNHFAVIEIERDIMDELKVRLQQIGFSDLKRVHDALWGIDEANESEITKMLYEVAIEYMQSMKNLRKVA